MSISRSQTADDWFHILGSRVHEAVERRRRDDDRRVKVAILDTGVDGGHPMFFNQTLDDYHCKNWSSTSRATDDEIGHGTHVAGLVVQVAPKVELYIGKVFDSTHADAGAPLRISEVWTCITNV